MTRHPRLIRLTFAAMMLLAVGCSGNPPEVDTAETIRTDPAKSAPSPAVVPEATPAKN